MQPPATKPPSRLKTIILSAAALSTIAIGAGTAYNNANKPQLNPANPPTQTTPAPVTPTPQAPDPTPHIKDYTPPAGATAQCNDGTYSYSQSARGTCSHHHGVAKWL